MRNGGLEQGKCDMDARRTEASERENSQMLGKGADITEHRGRGGKLLCA